MKLTAPTLKCFAWIAWAAAILELTGVTLAFAQEEMASSLRRYKNREVSSGT